MEWNHLPLPFLRPVTVSVHVDMNFAPVTVRIESGRDPEERLVAGRQDGFKHQSQSYVFQFEIVNILKIKYVVEEF